MCVKQPSGTPSLRGSIKDALLETSLYYPRKIGVFARHKWRIIFNENKKNGLSSFGAMELGLIMGASHPNKSFKRSAS